jgi:oxygen-dependent protoporphyrinogen oxidase
MKRIAIIGGGISGVTAAYELARMQRAGEQIEFTLYESSDRLGGTVSTRHAILSGVGHCVVELGPDGWVSEKPWARELAIELGLGSELVPSNDAERRTLLLRDGNLAAIPDGMRMMVPLDEEAIRDSPLLSEKARQTYLDETSRAAELRQLAAETSEDISVADFVRRHFGEEATRTFAGPLLAGIFGGDIEKLSARSTMPFFVTLEREHGSLISGLRAQSATRDSANAATSIFTSLRTGLASLIDAMAAQLPAGTVRMQQPVLAIAKNSSAWTITAAAGAESFDAVLLATRAHVTRSLLLPVNRELSDLHNIPASSAVLVTLAYSKKIVLPQAFGFLVQQPQQQFHPALLAGTFSHIKYPHTTPAAAMLLRVFFGGPQISRVEKLDDDAIVELAQHQLRQLFPEIPAADLAIVQRWPHSLPQYEIGHEDRVRQIESRVSAITGLHLLGSAYRGVGLPDMVRRAREHARSAVRPSANPSEIH